MQAETDNIQQDEPAGFQPNSTLGTLIVAGVLCLVCSLVVSTAAVSLRPLQEINRTNKMRRNVLIAAGHWDPQTNTDKDIPQLFEDVELILVNLPRATGDETAGTINSDIDAASFNYQQASRSPDQSISIPSDLDIAGIKRRAQVAPVYIVRGDDGEIESIVLPIYGKGLWSTLYGFLALKSDAQTVTGITFYEHAETPGLGGEVDNPKWKAEWPGKTALDNQGIPVLTVTKPGAADQPNEVDGLSGATITSVGVQNTVRYWLGEDGFGPFLERLRKGELALKSKP